MTYALDILRCGVAHLNRQRLQVNVNAVRKGTRPMGVVLNHSGLRFDLAGRALGARRDFPHYAAAVTRAAISINPNAASDAAMGDRVAKRLEENSYGVTIKIRLCHVADSKVRDLRPANSVCVTASKCG